MSAEGLELRYQQDADGRERLDELIAGTAIAVHVERMDGNEWLVRITLSSGDQVHLNLCSKGRIEALVEVNP